MIDRSKEKTFPLADFGKQLPIQKQYATVLIWQRDGLTNRHTGKKVKLDSVRGPNGRETSIEAYYRFLEALDRED